MDESFLPIEKFPELEEYASFIQTYDDLQKFSIEHPSLFWGKIARARLEWFKDFDEVCNTQSYDVNDDFYMKWFTGGKFNVAVNCVDRHYRKNPDKVALIWERDEPGTQEYFTYRQLYETMNKIANMLTAYGIKKGDCVAFYIQPSNYAVAALFACARLGVMHNCIFAEFPKAAIAVRINESDCVAIITDNEGRRNGKAIELKTVVDETIKICPTIRHTFVIDRSDRKYETNEKVINLRKEMEKYSTECEVEQLDPNHPLYITFTSGSTGKPKAIVHTHASFLIGVTLITQTMIGYKENMVNFFLGDLAWMGYQALGLYGPLSAGITTVLFDMNCFYPNPGRLWETLERLKINRFGFVPTSVRSLMEYENSWVSKYDLTSLDLLYVVGEPIHTKAWRWLYEVVGKSRVSISDGWGSTETGGLFATRTLVAGNYDEFVEKNMKPSLGAKFALVDDSGNELPCTNSNGHLCIKSIWPGMVKTLKNNHTKYLDTYMRPFKGYFYMGDRAFYDSNGLLTITGREDDVIKIRGLRIGSAELEEVVNTHDSIVESAVVSTPNKLTGWSPYVFMVIRNSNNLINEEQLINEIKSIISSSIVVYAMPTHFLIVDGLPKTRTGKLVRRVLCKITSNQYNDLGDLSGIENASCLDSIIRKHKLKYDS